MMKILHVFMIAVVGFLLFPCIKGHAAKANEFQFDVEPIFQEGQQPEGFYHIQVKPNNVYTLHAFVTNKGARELPLKIHPLNAYSNQQGIFYQKEASDISTAIVENPYKLVNYIKVKPGITLKPHESKKISFTVKAPEKATGTVLGGVQFIAFGGKKNVTPDEHSGQKAQFQVKEYHARNIAIQLDYPKAESAHVSFGKVTFDPKAANLHLEVENKAARIQDNISGTYKVEDDSGKPLFHGNLEKWKMAPKTRFLYPISLGAKSLSPGSYRFILHANVDGTRFEVKKRFKINQELAKQAQDHQSSDRPTVVIPKNSVPLWAWILIAVVILLLAGNGFLFYRLNKRKKSQDKKL